MARVRSAHARIIWGVAWSHDEALLATASRDSTVKLWATGALLQQQGAAQAPAEAEAAPAAAAAPGNELQLLATLPVFACGVTAVAFAGRAAQPPAGRVAVAGEEASCSTSSASEAVLGPYLLAVGLESGHVQVR